MWKPFKGVVWDSVRQARADGVRRFDLDEYLTQAAAVMLIQNINGEHSNKTTPIILEGVHYQVSHRVVYVSTPLAQQLADTRIEIPPDEIPLPWTLFELCFDDQFELRPGLKMASCLVMLRPDDATYSAMIRQYKKAADKAVKTINDFRVKHGVAPLPADAAEVNPGLQNDCYVLFRMDNSAAICQLHFAPSQYVGMTIDEAIEEVLKPGPLRGFAPLDPEEIELERAVCRILFGILCYLSTSEPEVEEWKDRNRPRLGVAPHGLLLGRTVRSSPGWHLRKRHMRYLRADRYARRPDGGIRYVWVRAAEINKEARPGGQAEKSEYVTEENA